ncbi:MAG: spore maturation protein A [Lachnospiraceae bacterium]|nr:spore maturation protein A [Lachnospiraceae bacterium]
MLSYIWCFMIITSIICAIATGNIENLSTAALSSAGEAVELVITMCGTVCLWSGFMAIADSSGVSEKISKIMSPFLSMLFPKLDKKGEAFKAISSNVTANLLGLGNAATPLGIKAMNELQKLNTKDKHTATRDMTIFVLLNTSSIQLIPTMILSILTANGATNPTDTVPKVWAASICGLAAALGTAFICERGDKGCRLRRR